MCLHALEEVFGKMALCIVLTAEGLGLFIKSLVAFARNRAARSPMSHKLLAEGQAVETVASASPRPAGSLRLAVSLRSAQEHRA